MFGIASSSVLVADSQIAVIMPPEQEGPQEVRTLTNNLNVQMLVLIVLFNYIEGIFCSLNFALVVKFFQPV